MDKQMEELSKELAIGKKKTADMLNFGDKVFDEMNSISDWTDDQAHFLANLCVKFDSGYGMGSQLTLEWLLDHYMSLVIENDGLPTYLAIYDALEKGGHDTHNKFEYFDAKTAFIVPHATKKIVVFGSDYHKEPKYLVMFEDGLISNELYVRWIWKKTKRDKMGTIIKPTLKFYKDRDFVMNTFSNDIYGDARDNGHVLTHKQSKRMNDDFKMGKPEHGKCDKVIWDTNRPLRWFFDIGCLLTSIEESK